MKHNNNNANARDAGNFVSIFSIGFPLRGISNITVFIRYLFYIGVFVVVYYVLRRLLLLAVVSINS